MIRRDVLAEIKADIHEAEVWVDQAEKPDMTDDQTVMFAQLSIARSLLALARASIAEYE